MHLSPVEGIRLALRGQGREVEIGRGRVQSVGSNTAMTWVALDPEGASLMSFAGGVDPTRVELGANLEGVRVFLEVAGSCFASAEVGDEKEPLAATIIADSNCSFGQLVVVVQLLKEAGCVRVGLSVNDEFPGFDAARERDETPDALVKRDGNSRARIVVNVGLASRRNGRPTIRVKL